jgi:hypothetical protein
MPSSEGPNTRDIAVTLTWTARQDELLIFGNTKMLGDLESKLGGACSQRRLIFRFLS